MFERYLTDALTTHFGHVVENIDSDKVRISAWNGELVLEDLTLRPTALSSFVADCPVEIAYGKVGNLELLLPWKIFGTAQKRPDGSGLFGMGCAVVLKDVNILITPTRQENKRRGHHSTATTPDSTENSRIQKEKVVQTLLDADLLKRVTESSLSSNRWKWLQDWLAGVFTNLSVTVKDIHIRYEDPGTSMGFEWTIHNKESSSPQPQYRPPFSVGISLRQFSVQTVDQNRTEESACKTNGETSKVCLAVEEKDEDGQIIQSSHISSRQSPSYSASGSFKISRKIVAADRLSVYWDSSCQLMSVDDNSFDVNCDRIERSRRYESCFADLNDGRVPSSVIEGSHWCRGQHTFLLDPISPSVELNLVSESEENIRRNPSELTDDDCTTDSASSNPKTDITPPSTISILLPPCKFTVSRSTLEDTTYVRKCFSVWKHAKKGLLSETSLRRLGRLRPFQSPSEDPKGWWLYAFEATIYLQRVSRDGKDTEFETSRHRKRGWIGLAEALGRRRRYLELYKNLIEGDDIEQKAAHITLMTMEDGLTTKEILSFRIALYEHMKRSTLLDSNDPRNQSRSKKHQTLVPSRQGGKDKGEESTLPTEANDTILSLAHRRRMVEEMSLAAEKETINTRNQLQVGERFASLAELDDAGSVEAGSNPVVWRASLVCQDLAIQVNDQPSDFSHRSRSHIAPKTARLIPVVKLSCAWVLEQSLYQDGSWDAECSLASLTARDLTLSMSKSHGGSNASLRTHFPNLIGRKRRRTEITDEDAVIIDGQKHHRSVTVLVHRRLHWQVPSQDSRGDVDRGSTTRTQIRILPMEVVYATIPVEALTRVLATVKTPEIEDDYHRMASVVLAWRERQKLKFLRALAHKHKKIIVDVKVGAPELLIPEDLSRRDSPMLVLDLGQLRIFNDNESVQNAMDFDDQWRVVLTNVQVLCSSVSAYAKPTNMAKEIAETTKKVILDAPQHLVEPFSLDFTILTKVVEDAERGQTDRTRVQVLATLPRLAFNLTASAIRLCRRMETQWKKRKIELNASSQVHLSAGGFFSGSGNLNSPTSPQKALSLESRPTGAQGSRSSISRIVEFQFSAPLIAFLLENDIDGRDCEAQNRPIDPNSRGAKTTPLVNLSFRGIQGKVIQEVSQTGGSMMQFDARLHSLGAVDLYQSAGKEFALLMSSVSPVMLCSQVPMDQEVSWQSLLEDQEKMRSESSADLVAITYNTTTKSSVERLTSDDPADKLSIRFHELYVEWNPETLAAIQKAIRVPAETQFASTPEAEELSECSEEEFFDAEEDVFFDAGSETDSGVYLISEISSSVGNSTDLDLAAPSSSINGQSIWSSTGLSMSFSNSESVSPTKVTSPLMYLHNTRMTGREVVSSKPPKKAFEFSFVLSKLRVDFNKESRHRRVLTAQMDGTSVRYATRVDGGSGTSMSIGNLVFTDPSSEQNTTIYGQILGLQSDSTKHAKFGARSSSSLLEMEILINPTTREFATLDENEKDEAQAEGVTIDCEQGLVQGCNYFVRATFSPMRFVFLEQLWFEFMDYFFEGIIGSRVWGGPQRTNNATPPALSNKSPSFINQNLVKRILPGSDAIGVSFTRFNIFLDAPVVLIPVTYRSPEFVRLEAASISVRNRYDSSIVGEELGSHPDKNGARRQWYNNCDVVLQDLTMFSWCGRELVTKAVVASVSAVWPTGPFAPLIIPKWNVNCKMDSLNISLRRSDYALFQNIISYNFGEASRNLDEWEALQNLSQDDAQQFQDKIMVHFGYDKKDVAPTTYNLNVSIPSVSFTLIEGESAADKPIAVARCIDLRWQLQKLNDLVVKQNLTCDVDIVATGNSSRLGNKLLSLTKLDSDKELENGGSEGGASTAPGLRYTSTSEPNGDNLKTLQICDASIFMIVPEWTRFSQFFQSLPDPMLLTVEDVGSSIQVGDRWYRIGVSSHSQENFDSADNKEFPRFSWISSEASPRRSMLTKASSSRRSTKFSRPSFQLRVLLISPQIVLTSIPAENETETRLILRMQHLDFLHVNNGKLRTVNKMFFFDGVEVYTRSNNNSDEGENSLIHPWCVAGTMDRCNGESIGDCKKHTVKISADVLHARAAYSDMATAIDVCLSIMHDARKDNSRRKQKQKTTSPASSGLSLEIATKQGTRATELSETEALYCSYPHENVYEVACDGFELLVVDDSGRHFAGAQELIILSLGKMTYTHDEIRHHYGQNGVESTNAPPTTAMNLRLHSLDLFDCLQPTTSPFRLAASSRSGAMGLQTVRDGKSMSRDLPAIGTKTPRRSMLWGDFAMVKDKIWGFDASPNLIHRTRQQSRTNREIGAPPSRATHEDSEHELIEVRSIASGGGTCDYHLKLRSLAVQWNPSTVIAIQRFLGRLRKESKMRAVKVINEQIDDLISSPSSDESEGEQNVVQQPSDVETNTSIRAVLDLDSLTICLNKEHQHRRLVEATLSGCNITLESSDSGLTLDGQIRGFNAWDADNYGESECGDLLILRPNRTLLKVASAKEGAAQDVVSDNSSSTIKAPFLEVHYKTFSDKDRNQSMLEREVPLWVQSHLAGTNFIDDYLSMSVASLEVVYLRERTEEILDYLSNGLPGKGMGATSRAAKGFLSKRIQTKSFLELHIDSPQVIVPQHENSGKGFALKLGDVNVRSWFEEASVRTQGRPNGDFHSNESEWWRLLSLSLTGLSGGTYEFQENDGLVSASSTKPIDLQVTLRKPTVRGRDTILRGKLSFVDAVLNYSDYVLLRAIARDNIGRKVDTEKWDNVEKAFWMEEATEDGGTDAFDALNLYLPGSSASQHADAHLAYSSNARFVRYGKKGRNKALNEDSASLQNEGLDGSTDMEISRSSTTLDLRFELDGLAIKLRRNDYVEWGSKSGSISDFFDYDVSLLRVQIVEVSVSTNSAGDMSFHLSLFRIGLFDLGDRGRMLRERHMMSSSESRPRGLRQPCPFSVLAEGYTPSTKHGHDEVEESGSDEAGPQFVVTVDRCAATSAGAIGSQAECQLPKDSKVTIARIVVNYLSVNALIRPFQEIAAFLSCAWATQPGCTRRAPRIRDRKTQVNISSKPEPKVEDQVNSESSGFQLKLVAHYPRIFFLADESDAHSRALVLRGLAVVNASLVKKVSVGSGRGKLTSLENEEVQRFVAVDAQLHRMESYINPDVDNALRFKRRHAELVGSSFSPADFHDGEDGEDGISSDTLGVALIQPVTTGIEYSEIRRDLFPTQRTLFVNMEPVSTMLSFEDLQLIEAVLKRWSSRRSAQSSKGVELDSAPVVPKISKEMHQHPSPKKETYSVVFTTKRLGLALKMENGAIVVQGTENAEHGSLIKPGDKMSKIDGGTIEARSLSDVVRQLSNAKRPTTICFVASELRTTENMDSSPSTPPAPSIDREGSSTSNDVIAPTNLPFVPSSDMDGIDSFTVWFRTGVPTGLKLEKRTFGIYPVVTKVLPGITAATTIEPIDESDMNQFEAVNVDFANGRVPRVGAVLVDVDGVAVEDLSYDELFRVLKRLGGGTPEESLVAIADNVLSKEFYSMSFVEVGSFLWGTIDSIDISAAGFTLSFIDDLKGRDMPLFRANINSVEVHVGRGLGIETSILDPASPEFLKLHGDAQGASRIVPANMEWVSSYSVTAFSAIALAALDYYHPRIAVWEPFLEPSQLYIQLESQPGGSDGTRPGQLAVEVSDRLLREKSFHRQMPPQMSEPQMVSLNLTDAAAEVFVKASLQWKEWRNTMVELLSSEGDDEIFFNPTPLSSQVQSLVSDSDPVLVEKLSFNGVLDESLDAKQDVKQRAAQKAAQAALVFAQKRGAETNKKGEKAKPFVFRNRTGVSIAFAQQKRDAGNRPDGRNSKLQRNLSVVGEYVGLAYYDSESIVELADQEDAKFDMEMLVDQDIGGEQNGGNGRVELQSVNRVRNYEGRFPCLLVAIQAVAGVSVDPLEDLQVYKVGSSIHHLIVRKEEGDSRRGRDSTAYSVPVVWKVEIEDNRRILTLSSAVRIVSAAFDTSFEVGVQKGLESGTRNSEAAIRSVGVSTPESPFYLPLWLALKLEAVRVFVRPKPSHSPLLSWGRTNVLEFSPVLGPRSNGAELALTDMGEWTWKENFSGLVFIRCEPFSKDMSTVWLSCFDAAQQAQLQSSVPRRPRTKAKRIASSTETREVANEVISVSLDSGLTLRNMLPINVEWEVAYLEEGTSLIVDGSSVRNASVNLSQFDFDERNTRSGIPLQSGGCTEVFSCDYKQENLHIRFKGLNGMKWSEWASLSLSRSTDVMEALDDEDAASGSESMQFPAARQVNVQVAADEFGSPLTFGVRVVPKSPQALLGDLSAGHIHGIEAIVFAELWIRNLTNLPLNFGCPAYQMHFDPGDVYGMSELSAARFTAESALMEIASVLEFGDKGTGLSNNSAREIAATGSIQNLPNQECSRLVEEVFEYVEIDNSTLKRRWWASESYDSYRENVTESSEGNHNWRWIDGSWAIDSSGSVETSTGGWESCRNLFAGSGSFNIKRKLESSHAIRRRRWFRARDTDTVNGLAGGLQAFHQPVNDSFSREQRKIAKKKKGKRRQPSQEEDKEKDKADNDEYLKVSIKNGGGRWSVPVSLPPTGTCHGVVRVLASRWPALTKLSKHVEDDDSLESMASVAGSRTQQLQPPPARFEKACLSPSMFELCYSASEVEGDWGEFSRCMRIYPRYLVRNDSRTISIEVKQTGSADHMAVKLAPGEAQPFYWADFRLPGLVSVRPSSKDDAGVCGYRWSGGFDICNLGMCPVRVRLNQSSSHSQVGNASIRSIRALVEIRPGTGGSGINVSFREEDPRGDGSLFRVENLSTFPVWLAQDGVLANPSSAAQRPNSHQSYGWSDNPEMVGDLVRPSNRMSLALDVPFRQGKYAHRKAATMPELLRVRIALAPLNSRSGIESVKVIGLTNVGDSIRLNPAKLVTTLPTTVRKALQSVRILGIVANDGPTRVLKLCLMEADKPDIVFGNPFGDVSYISSNGATASNENGIAASHSYTEDIVAAGVATLDKFRTEKFPNEGDAKRTAFYGDPNDKAGYGSETPSLQGLPSSSADQVYSVRAEFSGFLVSIVDSAPSEIATICLKNFNALSRWNAQRTTDASAILSIGWLQVDNHVPSAPFPVAVRPDDRRRETDDIDEDASVSPEKLQYDVYGSSPLLMVGLAFAPKHKSGIVCLRSVTVAPRSIVIALDLAFLVRMQRFVIGVLGHVNSRPQDGGVANLLYSEQKRTIPFPNFESQAKNMKKAAEFGVENQKLYFESLTILPCNINLSVAPARALTALQAQLEGKDTSAIHEAVRKGDVRVGSSSALFGVKVGRKNTTALAVVRGVLKSIVVDALLRLDGASLNFSGVFLRNHISTAPQLTTYLLAHYLASLRHNVPALIGSLAAFGNPLGLIRGLGDGMSDFVTEPVKGLKKSVKELDPSFLVDGVARGTESLARHTVGGFADSASLLTETFSKNMAVLTLDRRYAQKRDMGKSLRRTSDSNVTLAGGVESGFIKLVQGFSDGVTGVVKAPMRGAEKRGIEGFAKGVGKGLLGLLVKPMIGISDAATDVMIGVKSTVETGIGNQHPNRAHRNQYRPRRPMYGRDKVLRPYNIEDAAAATLMLQTRSGGENYLSHIDLGDRVALLSVRRILLLGPDGRELLALKFKHVASIEIRSMQQHDGSEGWGIVIVLNTPRRNGSDVEVVACSSRAQALELYNVMQHAL